MDIGIAIKKELNQRRMTYCDLSGITGIEVATISRIINGRTDPKLSRVQELARALELSTSELIARAESIPGSPYVERNQA